MAAGADNRWSCIYIYMCVHCARINSAVVTNERDFYNSDTFLENAPGFRARALYNSAGSVCVYNARVY